MKFKLRAQLLIALIVIVVSATLTYYNIVNEQKFALERSERSSKSIKLSFDAIVSDVEKFYTFRAYSTLHEKGIIDAMKRRDTLKLYELVADRYQMMQQENPYLIIMQFHAPDGRSILRVHRKNEYGDDIASRRPMLRQIHTFHKKLIGFEGGVQGMAFRIIVPVFEEGTYIGALEYGIDTGYFNEKIKQTTGSDTVWLIHQNLLGAADRNRYREGIGEYRFSTIHEAQKPIVNLFSNENQEIKYRTVTYGPQMFEVNSLFLKDAQERNVGVILSIHEITGETENVVDIIAGSVMLCIVMIVLFGGLFEYAFRTMLGKLEFQEEQIHAILDSQKNIVIVTDGKNIIYANRAFFEYTGYPTLESFREQHRCICDFFEKGDSREYLESEINGMIWTDYLIQFPEKEHKVKMTMEGKTSIFTVHSQKMVYHDAIRHVVVFTDITRLNELATLDVLTQVANRFQFDKILEYWMNLCERYDRTFSMLLIDIDHFKNVNDTYGHLQGDEVLKKIGQILLKSVRKSDIVARWGGEEFVILLPDSTLVSAAKLAETIRMRIEESDFAPVEQLTCSVGVSEWHRGENADAILQRVDEKLYDAKAKGRNQVVA